MAVQTRKACIDCGHEFEGNITVCPTDGTVLTPLAEPTMMGQAAIGQVIADKYEIIGTLGDGGMGSVYKAKHKLMKRIVAIKTLHPHLVASAAALKRFQQEAQAASSLNHPNILTIHDFGLTDQGIPYLVMDFLEGVSLASLLADGAHLELDRSIDIFMQTCAGLYHAHQKGIVHRDLKPGNIMLVDVDGTPDFVKIVDFGIAKLLPTSGLDASQLTQTGQVFGSPLYMSPEQCRAVADIDGRADIYALGCLMYRTLSGMPPFIGNDQIECMYKHVHENPASFHNVCPELNLPESIEHIIFKCMMKEPADRYQTMNDVRDALTAIRQSGTQVASTVLRETLVNPQPESQTSAPLTSTSEITAPQPAPQSTAPPVVLPPVLAKIKSHPKPIAIGVAVLLLLGAAGTQLFKSPAVVQEDKFSKYLSLGQSEFRSGNLTAAESNLKLAAAELSPAQKESDPKYATNLYILGQIEYAKGHYQEAKQKFRESQAIRTKVYGGDSGEVAEVLTALGRCYTALGEYDEAEPILKKALGSAELVSPAVPLQVADSLSGLGDLYIRQGNYKQAEQSLRRSLAMRQHTLGNNNVLVATSMNDLGQACQLQKHYPQAEQLYKSALKIWDSTTGANSAQKANTLVCLGTLYASTGQLTMASNSYNQAMEIQQQVLGKNSPVLAQTKKFAAQIQKHTRPASFRDWLR